MALELDKAALSFFALGIVSTIGEIMLEHRRAQRDALRNNIGTDGRASSWEHLDEVDLDEDD